MAGTLVKTSGSSLHQLGASMMQTTLGAFLRDSSDVVRVAAVRVLQDYMQALPTETTLPLQTPIIDALSSYLSALDPNELSDSEELMVTLIETLRDAIALNTTICIAPNSTALNLLFTMASQAPNNFQLTMLASETFEEIVKTISGLGDNAFVRLCELVLPALTGAFDVGAMTGENALTNVSQTMLLPFRHMHTDPKTAGGRNAGAPRAAWV